MDDIIGKMFAEYLANLEKVFVRLRQANLKPTSKKCNLFRMEVKLFVYIVPKEVVVTDPDNYRCSKSSGRSKE